MPNPDRGYLNKVAREPVAVPTAARLIGCKPCCVAVRKRAKTWPIKPVKVQLRNCGWC